MSSLKTNDPMIPGPLIELVYEMTKHSALDIFLLLLLFFWKTELSIDHIVRVINWANQNPGGSIHCCNNNKQNKTTPSPTSNNCGLILKIQQRNKKNFNFNVGERNVEMNKKIKLSEASWVQSQCSFPERVNNNLARKLFNSYSNRASWSVLSNSRL